MSGERPAWLKAHGRPWRDHGARVVFDNPWITLTEHQVTAPTGKSAVYGKVHFKNVAIAVLPLHPDGTVTLVGQHRFALGDYVWEIPEGGGPLEEAPLDAARRELREEVGLEAASWREILNVQISNSVTDERGIGYLAMDFSPTEKDPDDTEVIAIERVPFAEALEAAVAGWLPDALTVAMLLRAHHMAVTGELPADLARLMLGQGPTGA
jgi:8-oxo-dGTP pyrophosphatase MutT (NUDIX family)